MSKLFEALKDAADGAFVVDEELRILYWNEAAEDLLDFNWGEVIDQACFRILMGHDEQKRLICRRHCRVSKLALKSEPVSSFDVRMCTKHGDQRWLNMSIFTYHSGENGDKKAIVHLFRDINERKENEIFLRRLLEAARQYHSIASLNAPGPDMLLGELTQREREVLALMVQGHGTREIGQELSISTNTVRNHIQHILRKLQVHSRVEAVTYAITHNLV